MSGPWEDYGSNSGPWNDYAKPKAAVAAPPAGPQPSLMDRVVASPLGRFTQEMVVQPALNAPSALAHIITMLPGMAIDPRTLAYGANAVSQHEQGKYEEVLQRNRNTPGYPAARKQADAMMSSASPMTNTLTRPLNSTMAGMAGLFGGLDSSNAAADAQTASDAGFQEKHPLLSVGGSLLGSLALTPDGAALKKVSPGAPVPSIASLKTAARQAYASVDNSGMMISRSALRQLAKTVRDDLAAKGFHPQLQPKTATALASLDEAAKTRQSLQSLDVQRRIAGNATDPLNKSDTMMGRTVVDHIDDFVNTLGPHQVRGGILDQNALDQLAEARSLWQRAAKGDTIQGLIDKAKNNTSGFSQSGFENALRHQFRKLQNNQRGIGRFNKDEQAAIRKVANGTPTGNLMRQVGKLSPQGAIPLLAEITAISHFGPQALALPIAGGAGRAVATAMTKRNATQALEMMLLGKNAPAPAPALQLPVANPKAIPRGLFGSMLLQGNGQQQPAY